MHAGIRSATERAGLNSSPCYLRHQPLLSGDRSSFSAPKNPTLVLTLDANSEVSLIVERSKVVSCFRQSQPLFSPCGIFENHTVPVEGSIKVFCSISISQHVGVVNWGFGMYCPDQAGEVLSFFKPPFFSCNQSRTTRIHHRPATNNPFLFAFAHPAAAKRFAVFLISPHLVVYREAFGLPATASCSIPADDAGRQHPYLLPPCFPVSQQPADCPSHTASVK